MRCAVADLPIPALSNGRMGSVLSILPVNMKVLDELGGSFSKDNTASFAATRTLEVFTAVSLRKSERLRSNGLCGGTMAQDPAEHLC